MPIIDSFDFYPGRILAKKYKIISQLGAGWEGEVYLIRECMTGIEKTAKFFFPQRNLNDKSAKFYAKKLHKLRQCSIIVQYHSQDSIIYRGAPITFLLSEFIEGELLTEFLKRQPGKRLTPFQALHLLHALVLGIECIHRINDYHGDLHSDNIIVQRFGLGFDLKLLDMFHWGAPSPEHRHDDVIDLIHIFHLALGGQKHYANHPKEIKDICCGLKKSLILKKYRTTTRLRHHIETMQWN
ncbi:MAG: serine/threonine protein kinase [Gammaproteobacteria bacterium]|nr:serine/threonine protein kinase [Gammaproteobacteria bacterium]